MKTVLSLSLFLCISNLFVQAQDFGPKQENPFSLNVQGNRTSPALVDIDQDNDLDLLVGYASGNFGYYENTGTASAPTFSNFAIDPFNLNAASGNSTPFLADLDDDNDQDLISGTPLQYNENEGTAANATFGITMLNPFALIGPNGINKPYMIDIDNDSDFDLFIGATDGNTYFYQNTGTASIPSFAAAVTNAFGLESVGSRAAPSFADLDADGDFDALIGNQSGELHYFENTGSAVNPNYSFVGINPFNLDNVPQDAKPFFADLDDDGDLDLLVGDALGNHNFFENITPLGVDEPLYPETFIYPNPFDEICTIQFSNPIDSGSKLIIYDSSSRIVREVFINRGARSVQILKGTMSEGLYFVVLANSKVAKYIGKIVAY